jgi:hypothetical protein
MNDVEGMSKRDFIVSVLRLSTLAGLVGGTASLIAKDTLADETCKADGRCARCGELSGCGLPQAMSARTALRTHR